jgi:hypothetical protein
LIHSLAKSRSPSTAGNASAENGDSPGTGPGCQRKVVGEKTV